ncbi:MAG: hypothetical protein EOP05_11900 [Proteobacteria bacterium]|nr:MAG: hypothetical protein EOP05_11900 [Pseudomonadota bacterium]
MYGDVRSEVFGVSILPSMLESESGVGGNNPTDEGNRMNDQDEKTPPPCRAPNPEGSETDSQKIERLENAVALLLCTLEDLDLEVARLSYLQSR